LHFLAAIAEKSKESKLPINNVRKIIRKLNSKVPVLAIVTTNLYWSRPWFSLTL